MDNNKQIKTRDGLTLRGREWPQAPARGTIVLVHGLGEHVGRYAHVAAFFNGRGWRTRFMIVWSARWCRARCRAARP